MIKSLAAIVLIGMALPAQAASMVDYAHKLDNLRAYKEFQRSDPARAKTLIAPTNGGMVGFAKKVDAVKEYKWFKAFCHYKMNREYTCKHPTL